LTGARLMAVVGEIGGSGGKGKGLFVFQRCPRTQTTADPTVEEPTEEEDVGEETVDERDAADSQGTLDIPLEGEEGEDWSEDEEEVEEAPAPSKWAPRKKYGTR